LENKNRQIIFAKRPNGLPDQSTFELRETNIPELMPGEVVVQANFLSVDPYMRGRMKEEKSYAKPFELGKPLLGKVIGEVVKSKNANFVVGDYVEGLLDWADYSITDGSNIKKIDPEIQPKTAVSHILGMPGLTAYFGLLDIGKPKPGETVVVSGAAGAVGSIVGQIAKLKNCKVVGIAGNDDKIAYLKNELGFDEVINYRTTSNIKQALERVCPQGIDVYFDNVGGEISDGALSLLNFHARVPLCGQIALYNMETIETGPRILPHLLTRSVLLKGFIVRDYEERYEEGLKNLFMWYKEGKLKYRENIVEGLENAPDAFLGLFRGDNIGKQLVKVR